MAHPAFSGTVRKWVGSNTAPLGKDSPAQSTRHAFPPGGPFKRHGGLPRAPDVSWTGGFETARGAAEPSAERALASE